MSRIWYEQEVGSIVGACPGAIDLGVRWCVVLGGATIARGTERTLAQAKRVAMENARFFHRNALAVVLVHRQEGPVYLVAHG